MDCEMCAYYAYDEYDDTYLCTADMDEDDFAKVISGNNRTTCPYYRGGDEYAVVRHQM